MKSRKVTAGRNRRGVTKSPELHLGGKAPRAADADGEQYAALVRAATAGDAKALERLLMRAQEVAWRFSTAVCGGADDAEDAMQEALIKTYRHVGRIREPGAFKPWLYRTVRNACLMSRRKRAGEPARIQSLSDEDPQMPGIPAIEPVASGKDPEQIAAHSGLRRRLQVALRTLPAPYRAVVFLREMEGLSTREVAAVLGMSEDNVKTRLHRARVQLQAALLGAPQ